MRERILTSTQVASILQVHPFTVLKYIKQGKLKGSKLGRRYRIRESDLESFLNKQSVARPDTSIVTPTATPKAKTHNQETSVPPIPSTPSHDITPEIDENFVLE